MMSSNLSSGRTCSSRYIGSGSRARSEEHTSELQSQSNLVCRLLLEKKKKNRHYALMRAHGLGHRVHDSMAPYLVNILDATPLVVAVTASVFRDAVSFRSLSELTLDQ